MLDDVPWDVKGKLTTGFKDNSLRSLLQLSVIQEFASWFLPLKHFYQKRTVLQRRRKRKEKDFLFLFFLIKNDSHQFLKI